MHIPRFASWALILLLVSSISAVAADDPVEAAVNRLSMVKVFAFGGIGYAGVISPGEKDFKIVLAQPKPTALQAFERLYATGNPQGKSYALSGLKKLAPERFAELTERLKNSSEKVEVERGCIVLGEPLPETENRSLKGISGSEATTQNL